MQELGSLLDTLPEVYAAKAFGRKSKWAGHPVEWCSDFRKEQ
jgi:hypothetical protein